MAGLRRGEALAVVGRDARGRRDRECARAGRLVRSMPLVHWGPSVGALERPTRRLEGSLLQPGTTLEPRCPGTGVSDLHSSMTLDGYKFPEKMVVSS